MYPASPPPPPECMVSKLKDCRQNICHMTWLARNHSKPQKQQNLLFSSLADFRKALIIYPDRSYVMSWEGIQGCFLEAQYVFGYRTQTYLIL